MEWVVNKNVKARDRKKLENVYVWGHFPQWRIWEILQNNEKNTTMKYFGRYAFTLSKLVAQKYIGEKSHVIRELKKGEPQKLQEEIPSLCASPLHCPFVCQSTHLKNGHQWLPGLFSVKEPTVLQGLLQFFFVFKKIMAPNLHIAW